ncbi:MAG: putative transcriptional regulator, TetR family [Sphaerisporangium sp.]|jgi:TetR/AcrR family transcriptional repressor of lmrAB and yxaGH operons|nr:putative transcriptional regulator, TetR family [Sphaerisporangium sp.]
MGQKGEDTRTRLLDATLELIESGGYFGAGLNQVVAASGAPRGSLYYHFPDGKDQLVSESVTRAGQDIAAMITRLEAFDTADLLIQLLDLLGDRLEQSEWRKGCPVATVALELAASNDAVQKVCSAAYTSWEAALHDRLISDGHPDAEDLATTVLALIEGGLLLARTHRSRQPLTRVSRMIKTLL